MKKDEYIIPLTQVKVGTLCRVVQVNSQGAVRQRMLSLGLVPGVVLQVVRYAPMGDPIEIRIKRFLMSVRKEEAENVMVLPMGDCPGRGDCREQGRGYGRGRHFRRFFNEK